MDLFEKPKEKEVLHGVDGSAEWVKDQIKKDVINPSKHFKRFGRKKPIDKIIAKKVNWREDL